MHLVRYKYTARGINVYFKRAQSQSSRDVHTRDDWTIAPVPIIRYSPLWFVRYDRRKLCWVLGPARMICKIRCHGIMSVDSLSDSFCFVFFLSHKF